MLRRRCIAQLGIEFSFRRIEQRPDHRLPCTVERRCPMARRFEHEPIVHRPMLCEQAAPHAVPGRSQCRPVRDGSKCAREFGRPIEALYRRAHTFSRGEPASRTDLSTHQHDPPPGGFRRGAEPAPRPGCVIARSRIEATLTLGPRIGAGVERLVFDRPEDHRESEVTRRCTPCMGAQAEQLHARRCLVSRPRLPDQVARRHVTRCRIVECTHERIGDRDLVEQRVRVRARHPFEQEFDVIGNTSQQQGKPRILDTLRPDSQGREAIVHRRREMAQPDLDAFAQELPCALPQAGASRVQSLCARRLSLVILAEIERARGSCIPTLPCANRAPSLRGERSERVVTGRTTPRQCSILGQIPT